MMRWVGWMLLLSAGGCALPGMDGPYADARGGQYDFDWRLSGDPAVAPLQVFASGSQVWLQFAGAQEVPAIFGATPQGDRLVAWRRQGPYVVVDGGWQALTLRGGRAVARAVRAGAQAMADAGASPGGLAGPAGDSTSHAGAVPAVAAPAATALAGGAAMAEAPPPAAAPGARGDAGAHSRLLAAPPVRPAPMPMAAPMPAPSGAAAFQAGPPEATLRAVLAKWAQASGWTFQSQHWAVEVDIPLAGSAGFGGDFKQAVRALLASTELTERPVQPCFYANRVLRVVPYTQACDRSAVSAEVAS